MTPTTPTTATTTRTRAAARASSPGASPALAAIGKDGDVYAGGADGGVWRSTTGRGNWDADRGQAAVALVGRPEARRLDGALWYATGEANTGGTSYVGSGVYRLANPATGTFRASEPRRRHRAREHDDPTRSASRRHVSGRRPCAASTRTRSAARPSTPWKLLFAPSPSYLPGGANAGDANAGYKNIVNDLAIDPKDAKHMIAAAGWRAVTRTTASTRSKDAGDHWTKINPSGAINPKDIGYATFAFAADGSKLYVMNQSTEPLNKATGTRQQLPRRHLRVEHRHRSPARGTRSRTRRSSPTRARRSSSASAARVTGPACRPGTTSSSRSTRPTPNHVYAGLEEVYETQNGGATWNDHRALLELLLLLLGGPIR